MTNGEIPKDIAKKLKGKPTKVGDVEVRNVEPDRIFPELYKESWECVNYLHEVEWTDIDELKAMYPKKAKDIRENQRAYYDYSTHEVSMPERKVMVRCFWHKPTKWLPEGAYIKYTDDVVLSWTSFPYKHGKLPYVVDADMEVERELWARPAISQIEQKNRQYNNIDSAIARDLGVGSAPKWMIPKGAVDFRSVNNEFTVVEYKGPIEPKLVASNPVSQHAITIQDRLESRMSKLMKVYDISRGEVPAGVTANSALRFLDEQETQVLADDEKKRKKRILDVYKMMMNVMAQYYMAEDGRTVRTLGEDNGYMIESLKEADFTQVYDVQFQNAPALPDTKTGKIAAIVDLNAATQTDPIFRREDIVQMLDLGLDDSYVDQATVSLKANQQFIQDLSRGKDIPEPQMYDDLMVGYATFWKHIQSYAFKTRTDPTIQARFFEHIKTMEGLLYLKSLQNPKLSMELANFSNFPAFFELPEPPVPVTPPMEGGGTAAVDTSKMNATNANIENAQKAEQDNI